jgi:hypothetical protein
MTTIRTPYGLAPDSDDTPPLDRRLLALCGEFDVLEAEVGRLTAAIEALRHRITALERRGVVRRRRGALR